MMKLNNYYVFFLMLTGYMAPAQPALVTEINRINPAATGLAPLRFLASDELMGRGTYRPEIHIAARYISEYFRGLGIKEVTGTSDYFQSFLIKTITPSANGKLAVGTGSYLLGIDLLQCKGEDLNLEAPIIYAGFGTKADLDKIDIRGKIIITDMGIADSSGFREALRAMDEKAVMAKERGALAIVERYRKNIAPWARLKGFYTREHVVQEEGTGFPLFIADDSAFNLPGQIQAGVTKAVISVSGTQVKSVAAENLMGWVEGTDPVLRDQFVVLSAHYDHLGVAKQPKMEEGKLDSIYNGARDNAVGTSAVMDAARYFAIHPSKRSILFIAYTAEEIGEVGSKYFAAHPTIPLKQLVYNLNIDNASYNDTSIVTVIGLGRTSADEDIKNACAAFGLTAMGDPDPRQNFFDRSDNTNLAVKGIPAPTFSLGMRQMDEEINKRYHQLSDEVGNLNLSYIMKFIDAFILASKNIADNKNQPFWIKGDKYEAAWKTLYNK